MRKHTYHVFTPFCRFQNIVVFTQRLFSEKVQWHPIFDARITFSINADWIHPMVCPRKEPGWFVGHWYQNWWVEHAEIVDEDRYIMCSDDDLFQEGFFDSMDAHEGELLVAAMQRQPDRLYAVPEYMHCGGVGGEQVMMTGRVLKQFRWGPSLTGDWDFIGAAMAKYPPVFVPEAVVWFNVLDRQDFYPP